MSALMERNKKQSVESERRLFFVILILVAVTIYLLSVSCGSGSTTEDDDDDAGSDALVTVSGTIEYAGDVQGDHLVFGLIEQWPMTAAPKQIVEYPISEDGFPMTYSIEVDYTGDFFLACFMDVDPMDGVMMNLELDPMHVPGENEQKVTLVDGENTKDFVLVDPEDVDFWWIEE